MGSDERSPRTQQQKITQADIDEWLTRTRKGRETRGVQKALAERTLLWWNGKKPSARFVMRRW